MCTFGFRLLFHRIFDGFFSLPLAIIDATFGGDRVGAHKGLRVLLGGADRRNDRFRWNSGGKHFLHHVS